MDNKQTMRTLFRVSTVILIIIQLSNLFFAVSEFFANISDPAKLQALIQSNPELKTQGVTVDPELLRTMLMVIGGLTLFFSLLIIFLLVRKLFKESSGKFITRGVYLFLAVPAILSIIARRVYISMDINFILIIVTAILSILAIVAATNLNQDRRKRPDRDYQEIPRAVATGDKNEEAGYQYYNPAYNKDADSVKKPGINDIDQDNYRN